MLDSVSVFRWILLSWAQSTEVVPISSSIDWAQLSRFHLEPETESSLRNVVFQTNTERLIMFRNTKIILSNMFFFPIILKKHLHRLHPQGLVRL
jgi:hypothetical protein